MAYPGKYRDYTPIICPAGKPIEVTCTVAECLQVYPVDDAFETVFHEAGLKPVEPVHKNQRMPNWRHRGVFQEIRDNLRRPVETRYQTLLKDLKETTADSYWNKEIGRSRDPIGGLPSGMDPTTTTYGCKTLREVTMKELINPPVTRFEILCETDEHHPMYRKSHNDYYPAEQVNRNYYQPAYNPQKKYGRRSGYDKRGRCAKECLDYNSEPIRTSNAVQADFVDRSAFRLGKSLTPNHSAKLVPPDYRFGKASERPLYNLEELLRPDLRPNLLRKDYLIWITHLNELRNYLKRKSMDLEELRNNCLYFDEEGNGWLPIEILFKIFSAKGITFNHNHMFSLAHMMGYINESDIRYKEFIDLLNIRVQLPPMGKFDDGDPSEYFRTSYKEARKDYLKVDNSTWPKAGISSRRIDLSKPQRDPLSGTAGRVNLGAETTVTALISPSIYSNYSLSHLDFWAPRKPTYMRKLFMNLGYEFPGDTFERLWAAGQHFDNSEDVCVDTFKAIMDQAAPLEKKPQPPAICDENLLQRKCGK